MKNLLASAETRTTTIKWNAYATIHRPAIAAELFLIKENTEILVGIHNFFLTGRHIV